MWPRLWPPRNCWAHSRGGSFLLATNMALALPVATSELLSPLAGPVCYGGH